MSPACPGRIWLQHHGGVYRSDDRGDNWHNVSEDLPSDFGFPIVAHPKKPDTAYVIPLNSDLGRWFYGGKAAVYRTDDAGLTWQACSLGLPPRAYTNVLRNAFVTCSQDPMALLFGTTSGAAYVSFDEGESFSELCTNLPRILSVGVAAAAP